MKEYEMGEACSIHGRDEKYIEFLSEKLKRPFDRSRHMMQDNIKIDLKEI
jgi:hypothetical protein